MWRLAKSLTKVGHETHVVATTPHEAFEEEREGIPTWHIHAAYRERFRAWLSLWNPQTVRAFGRLLRRIQPDVVNAHNIHYLLSYHTLKLARDAGCGVVFSAHDAMTFAYGKLPASFNPADFALRNPGDYRLPRGFNLRQNRFRYNPVRNRIIKHYLERHAHIRTAPSQALADAYAHNSMPAVEVVHNGIELDERQLADTSLADDLRRRLNLVGKRVILIAGRLTVEKGLRQILLALNDLHQQFPQLRLLILTSRELDGRISEEFAHLRQLLCVGGWLNGAELRAAYHLADVVAAPSIYVDPFPTVVLEAMAAGKPVVATSFGGAREAVVDGETGYIVNPFDTANFANRLARLLREPAMCRKMGRMGRERIAAQFSIAGQVEKMVDVYERALEMR